MTCSFNHIHCCCCSGRNWLIGFAVAISATISFAQSAKSNDDADLNSRIMAITTAFNNMEFDQALKLMDDSELEEHPSLLLLKAFCHEMGIGTAIDSMKSREFALKAAEREDWEAAQFLAWQSITGYTGDPNLFEAEEWRNRISQWKTNDAHPPALPEKILVPDNEGYVPRFELVSPWIQEKAREMDPVAQYNLYKILIDGRSTNPNVNVAMGLLQQSADGGYGAAAKMMAFYYEYGFILQKNERMEIKYLRIAAQDGDAESQYKLAMKLINSAPGEKVPDTVIELLEKAADQKHAKAIKVLADLYYRGEKVDKNLSKAYILYNKAAGMGHADAMYEKGWMLTFGQGIYEDKNKGIESFKAAVDLGSSAAAVRLAKIYLYGWGVHKEAETAKSYALKAIEMGNANGQRLLAEYYYRGDPENPDFENAFLSYETGARDGDDGCQYMMGRMLFMGRGIERDLEESLSWYRLAAAKGHRKAYMEALKMEGLGWGTVANPEKLMEHYRETITEQDDLIERTVDSMLNQLEQSDSELNPQQSHLLDVLKLADDPTQADFVRNEIIDYKLNWFRDRIIDKISDKPEFIMENPLSDNEWNKRVEQAMAGRTKRNISYPPEPLQQPSPTYPSYLRLFKVEDTVSLMLVVSSDGWIDDISYLEQPLPQFKDAIEDALQHWRFIPASRNGKPVSARIRIAIPFRIRKD